MVGPCPKHPGLVETLQRLVLVLGRMRKRFERNLSRLAIPVSPVAQSGLRGVQQVFHQGQYSYARKNPEVHAPSTPLALCRGFQGSAAKAS